MFKHEHMIFTLSSPFPKDKLQMLIEKNKIQINCTMASEIGHLNICSNGTNVSFVLFGEFGNMVYTIPLENCIDAFNSILCEI